MSAHRSLVIGSSGGIGQALVRALKKQGSDVTGLSRREDGFDLLCEDSIADAFARLVGSYDLVLVATGALEIDGIGPEKSLRHITAENLAAQFALNAVGPALVLKCALSHMPRDRRCVFAALSARVGSIGDNRLGGWYSYRAAKAALNQLIHTAAIEVKRSHKQGICVALHPGTVATNLSEKFARETVSPDHAAANLLRVIEGLSSADSGGFFDWAGKRIVW